MENEFILLPEENNEADKKSNKAEAERIKQMVYAEHPAVKHAATEHFRYRIKRICFQAVRYNRSVKLELVNMIENGSHVENQHAENFIEIFYILEENGKR